jgi:hypothetical protein
LTAWVTGGDGFHPLPFGFDYHDYKLVRNNAEQASIRTMGQQPASGLSLREIAGKLNLMPMPSK